MKGFHRRGLGNTRCARRERPLRSDLTRGEQRGACRGGRLRDRRPAGGADRPPRAAAGGAGGALQGAESGRVPRFAGRAAVRGGIDVLGDHRDDPSPQYLRWIEQGAHPSAAGITRDRQMRTEVFDAIRRVRPVQRSSSRVPGLAMDGAGANL